MSKCVQVRENARLSIFRTLGRSSAYGGTRTVAREYQPYARSHSSDGAAVERDDAMTEQVHQTVLVLDNFDRRPRQSRDRGTCCSNNASRLTVLVGPAETVEPPVETENKCHCYMIADWWSAPRHFALDPARTQAR